MDEIILKKIEEQQLKIDQLYVSVEKMRKYFLWTLIISILVIVLHLIGLVFAIPNFLKSYDSILNSSL